MDEVVQRHDHARAAERHAEHGQRAADRLEQRRPEQHRQSQRQHDGATNELEHAPLALLDARHPHGHDDHAEDQEFVEQVDQHVQQQQGDECAGRDAGVGEQRRPQDRQARRAGELDERDPEGHAARGGERGGNEALAFMIPRMRR